MHGWQRVESLLQGRGLGYTPRALPLASKAACVLAPRHPCMARCLLSIACPQVNIYLSGNPDLRGLGIDDGSEAPLPTEAEQAAEAEQEAGAGAEGGGGAPREPEQTGAADASEEAPASGAELEGTSAEATAGDTSDGLSSGAIAGITIGVLAAVAVLAGTGVWYRKRRQRGSLGNQTSSGRFQRFEDDGAALELSSGPARV